MSHQSELIANDILGYLHQHENKDMLRFITCGSVDDGKSTLIGRLLHDSKLIFEDQLAAIERDSRKFNTTDQDIDLALLVDGLQAEREQGITIDVAYRYFSTEKRKFIIADCPGHEQYTRNMATGASTCNLAIILIDARYGLQPQTRRHSFIVNQLGIRHVIVAINKMDLVDYSAEVFANIRQAYQDFAAVLNIPDIRFVPMSALRGDNVVTPSMHMPWYNDPTLMQLLEHVVISQDVQLDALRLPVQLVSRPHQDFRGFSGTLAAGSVKRGDPVLALPSCQKAHVRDILVAGVEAEQAVCGQAITLTLDREIDVSRGDMLVHAEEAQPLIATRLDVNMVWLQETSLQPGLEYLIKIGGRMLPGQVEFVHHRTNINTLEHEPAATLQLNDIGFCRVQLSQQAVFDSYRDCRGTGSLILIDRATNATAAAGMIKGIVDTAVTPREPSDYERLKNFEVELNRLVRQYFPHWGALDITKT
ncbi:MAG: sulfate adenylyltransferase subunit CysN [Pseudomonadales bacterium]|nr:sulfate adenylyltransferase subunit CysN [Pseudomonadales bacterium]